MRYFGPPLKFAISFRGRLDKSQVLMGVPTVTEVETTDLRITNMAVNVADLVIKGQRIPAGYAVQFKARGFLATTPCYRFRVAATASQWAEPTIPSLSTPPEIKVGYLLCRTE